MEAGNAVDQGGIINLYPATFLHDSRSLQTCRALLPIVRFSRLLLMSAQNLPDYSEGDLSTRVIFSSHVLACLALRFRSQGFMLPLLYLHIF
jgi:hypothetical protein